MFNIEEPIQNNRGGKINIIAGDQRFNSVHWLAGVDQSLLSKLLRLAGVECEGKILELMVILHNDLLGVAKGNDKTHLEKNSQSFF